MFLKSYYSIKKEDIGTIADFEFFVSQTCFSVSKMMNDDKN